jgi:hypothetical protein
MISKLRLALSLRLTCSVLRNYPNPAGQGHPVGECGAGGRSGAGVGFGGEVCAVKCGVAAVIDLFERQGWHTLQWARTGRRPQIDKSPCGLHGTS